MYSYILGFFFIIIIVLICVKLYIKITTGWCISNVCLVGKTVLITGGNGGIGYEAAADMAKRGATVILACRNEAKAKQAVEKLITETDNKNISYRILDLSSLESVRKCAKEINRTVKKLDILINNAGILGNNDSSQMTADGFEIIIQTNYLGHFLFTHLLLDLLKKSTPSRIINIASIASSCRSFPSEIDDLKNGKLMGFVLYSYSKLCNILYTRELHKRLENTGITTYSVHPGLIQTNIWSEAEVPLTNLCNLILRLFFKTEIEGAQTTIHCAVTKGIEKYSGRLFADCRLREFYKTAQDPDLPSHLWEKTEEWLNLKKQD